MNLNATILGQAITFILFVWFCMKHVWPPIIIAIEKRQQELSDGLAATERAKKDLDLAQSSAADYIKTAKAEAQVIIAQANRFKAQIIDAAKVTAQQEYKKIVIKAQVDMNTQRKRVREELRQDIAMLAIAGAEKIIERSIDKAVHDEIIDKLITQL
ncbi:F0F1 ATP synthase subunit B [Candidatus Gillettellia adelgis]